MYNRINGIGYYLDNPSNHYLGEMYILISDIDYKLYNYYSIFTAIDHFYYNNYKVMNILSEKDKELLIYYMGEYEKPVNGRFIPRHIILNAESLDNNELWILRNGMTLPSEILRYPNDKFVHMRHYG